MIVGRRCAPRYDRPQASGNTTGIGQGDGNRSTGSVVPARPPARELSTDRTTTTAVRIHVTSGWLVVITDWSASPTCVRAARHHRRGRRSPRRVQHRTHPQHAHHAPPARHLAGATTDPEGRHGRPAHPPRRHRPSRRLQAVHGPATAGRSGDIRSWSPPAPTPTTKRPSSAYGPPPRSSPT